MNQEVLSSLEIDAIGEITNISLGSSATAISTMLNSRVEITVPRVKVETYENFEFRNLEPAIAVTIDYVQGISGSNIMILKKDDVRVILETLMHTELDPENFELDEIGISAVCEVMNQMMGASSTALSELLDRVINISTPTTFEVKDVKTFKDRNFKPGETFVVIEFDLTIENKLKSEFINVLPMGLVRDMISTFMGGMDFEGNLEEAEQAEGHKQIISEDKPPAETESPSPSSGGVMSQEAIEAMLAKSREPVKEPAKEAKPAGASMTQEEIEALLSGGSLQRETEPVKTPEPAKEIEQAGPGLVQPETERAYAPKEPRVIDVKDSASDKSHLTGIVRPENLDMIMDVPLVVSVEIGRTKKPIREILEITQGSLIVLDKMAGDQVELYANNRCIAKGDVVVVHDNFGIRITEVMGKS